MNRIQTAIATVLGVVAIAGPVIALVFQIGIISERQQSILARLDKIETHLIVMEQRLDTFTSADTQMEIRITRLEALMCAKDKTLCK